MLFDSFNKTEFVKSSSSMQKQYEALLKLKEEYPNNVKISEQLNMAKKGLDGEKEIAYQLDKSNLGLLVIHDLNLQYENQTAQIDYVVISKRYCYFIECKKLTGDIIINERGDFIREYTINGRKVKKGMESPLRQVEAQRDVYKKLWNINRSSNRIINNIKRAMAEENFTDTYRVLVVAANNETILNTKYAPKDMKNKVIKADALVRKIELDLKISDKDLWLSKKEMEKWASSFLMLHREKRIDYYELYKQKYVKDNINFNDETLREKLIEFRKERSKEMNIPAYYVFTNDELEQLLKIRPTTIEQLKDSNILISVKVKTHGSKIVQIIKETTN